MVEIRIDLPHDNIGVIASLAKRCPGLGRTALMKLAYFLQTLRDVPLGYHFTLYSYGPYEPSVLAHLEYAEMLGLVTSSVVNYVGGFGYRIESTPSFHEESYRFVSTYRDDIEWVVREFGTYNASQLELASTIVFAARENRANPSSMSELARRVKDIKPRFTLDQITYVADLLNSKGFLA